jgi:hypothetical protein
MSATTGIAGHLASGAHGAEPMAVGVFPVFPVASPHREQREAAVS